MERNNRKTATAEYMPIEVTADQQIISVADATFVPTARERRRTDGKEGAGLARQRRRSIQTEPKSTDIAITTTDITTVEPDIEFEDGVIQGKAIYAGVERGLWALCALAVRVKKSKYGEQTYKKFFAEIGVGSVGERHLTVYRAWCGTFASSAGTEAPGPESVPFTVLRELQSHPNRAELLKSNPTMKKEDAVKLMRKHRKQTQVRVWRRDHFEEVINKIEDAAECAKDLEPKLVLEAADYRLLLEIVMPRRTQLVRDFRAGGNALLNIATLLEGLEQLISDTDRQRGAAEDEAAARLGSYRATAAEAADALAPAAADGEADDDVTEEQVEDTDAHAAA